MTLRLKLLLALVAALLLAALLAPLLAPAAPDAGSTAQRLLSPGSPGHPLGTDGQGRDLLSRLLYGARPSLLAGIVPVLVAGLLGTAIGLLAPLSRRWVETLALRSVDVLYAFPGVLLAIAIAAALGPGLRTTIVALSVALTAPIVRVVQTEVLRFRSADFLDVARASGASWWAIALRQALPLVLPALVVYCTTLVGLAIVYAAGLSYLGLGVAPPAAEWGSMLDELRQNVYTDPVLALLPATTILLVSVLFNALGDALREALDVKEPRP